MEGSIHEKPLLPLTGLGVIVEDGEDGEDGEDKSISPPLSSLTTLTHLNRTSPSIDHNGFLSKRTFVASSHVYENLVEGITKANITFSPQGQGWGILFRLEASAPFCLKTYTSGDYIQSTCIPDGRNRHVLYFPNGLPIGMLVYYKICIYSHKTDMNVKSQYYPMTQKECKEWAKHEQVFVVPFPPHNVIVISTTTGRDAGGLSVRYMLKK